MAGGKISFGADAKDFISGVKSGIIEPLEDAQKVIDKLGKGSDLGSLEKDMKGAQSATDKYNKELKDAVDNIRQVSRASKASTKEVSDDFELSAREQTKLRKEAIHEIGSEAKQNAAETFSSFDGSAQSFVDGIQGTLGGLVASLGPMGLAIGAAGALGIGLINGALQKADENSQQFKADVGDLTQALIDAGNTGEVSIDRVVQKLQELATTGDDAGVTLGKLHDLTSKTGHSFEDTAQAYAGNSKALKELVQQGKDRVAQLEREGAATDQNNDKQRAAYAGLIDRANAQKDLNSFLQQAADKASEAEKNDKLYRESGAPELAAKATAVQNIADSYKEAAGDVQDYTDKESGAFDTDAYIKGFEKKAQALADYKTNLQKAAVSLSPDALAFLESQGTDAASTLVSSYVNGTAAQQASLNKVWSQAGSASAGSFTNSFKGGIPTSVPGPEVVARYRVDKSALDAAIRSQVGVNIPVNIIPRLNGKVVPW